MNGATAGNITVSDLGLCLSQFVASRPNGYADPSMRVFDFASPDGANQSLEQEIVLLINIIQLAIVSGVLDT